MLGYVILLAPLCASIFAAAFAFRPKMLIAAIIPVACLSVALVCAIALFPSVHNGSVESFSLFSWIVAGGFDISFSFAIDGVAMVMICVVLIVSLLVHIYSIGYMSHDRGFNKFFAFLSAFVFSMLVLVMSDNFLGLFVGWEGVGLCSWMLIGFWYERKSASFAANEAFIMNRVADLAMLLGIFLLFITFGSLEYSAVFASVGDVSKSSLIFVGVLLFIGAMGKSAQFPFHTWLADAMEGPTPVSALIHAATMVTAGVYLVIRANPIYDAIPQFGEFIAYLGTFVAVFAASMALVNNDLKRIIAYSTLSQLGYMFVAAGLGFYWIALFHLMTHAFFKSLLFLGAGNVMHAMNDKLDISKMGALFKPMKYTAILMTIASIALSGIYPFAGFFSKDKILESAFVSGHYVLWIVLLFSAFLTAFYSFRLLMLVFFTPKRHDLHPHEASPVMLLAMLPLGILAIIAGFSEHSFVEYLSNIYLPANALNIATATLIGLIAIASVVALSGIITAIVVYKKGIRILSSESKIYKILFHQYYIPALYNRYIIKPYMAIAGFLWKECDMRIIDFVVDAIARLVLWSGRQSQGIQSGNLSNYLMLMISGIFVLLVILFVF